MSRYIMFFLTGVWSKRSLKRVKEWKSEKLKSVSFQNVLLISSSKYVVTSLGGLCIYDINQYCDPVCGVDWVTKTIWSLQRHLGKVRMFIWWYNNSNLKCTSVGTGWWTGRFKTKHFWQLYVLESIFVRFGFKRNHC